MKFTVLLLAIIVNAFGLDSIHIPIPESCSIKVTCLDMDKQQSIAVSLDKRSSFYRIIPLASKIKGDPIKYVINEVDSDLLYSKAKSLLINQGKIDNNRNLPNKSLSISIGTDIRISISYIINDNTDFEVLDLYNHIHDLRD